ncbi:MAG TPA: phosphoglycerate dehydrogenase [Edaphocola sp.]|nr:phosphoglycerate dehydrogenase [Edaphocola sp.]
MEANNTQKYFIIDFDSTFASVEGLDELANIALEKLPEKEKIVNQIKELTNQGMEGTISFSESLHKRLALLAANKSDVEKLINFLRKNISKSFERNRLFLKENANNIFIVSNGFKDFIVPIVTELGLLEEQVFANQFRYDNEGNIIGLDEENVLASDGGKKKILAQLNLKGDVYVIGDGYTDYELKSSGFANKFYAFTENVERENVVQLSGNSVASLDEILFENKLSRSQSYPKTKIKVLLLEDVHPVAVKSFSDQGFKVEVRKGALSEEELCDCLKDVAILGIRSKTKITKKVLDHAPRLMAIGAFCIGTNQIDLDAATDKGIVIFNAPYSNTRSVVELAIGEMIMLIRKVFDKSNKLHQGQWEKSASGSFEIRNKILGIVGYGNIGAQLAILAEALGMRVYFFDLADRLSMGNVQRTDSLDELLQIADVVSLHVDGRADNKYLIGTREFNFMKDGVVFLNLSRGHVVDLKALSTAIKSGKVSGAAVDVFPYEPKDNNEKFESELCELENVILTPHVGGSTIEAQENIGRFVPSKFLEYINNGSTNGSVNFPEVQLPLLKDSHRILHIHKNIPGVMSQINSIFAKYQININGQYLKTNERIGYVILDIEKDYKEELIRELKQVEGTIRFRILF